MVISGVCVLPLPGMFLYHGMKASLFFPITIFHSATAAAISA